MSHVWEIEKRAHCENSRLIAEELANLELLIDTTRPLTSVVPQYEYEERKIDGPSVKLHEYAPM